MENSGVKKWQYMLFLAIVGAVGGVLVELVLYLFNTAAGLSPRSVLINAITGAVIGLAIAGFGSKNLGNKQ